VNAQNDPARFDPGDVTTVLCDLDGVVWLAHEPIEGSVDAVARLRASGRRVLFVTNNSMSPVADQEAALERIGIPAAGDVVTSAMAGASLVEAGERVLVAGGRGVVEAVERRGATPVLNDGSSGLRAEAAAGAFAAVVVGLHRDFDYWRLAVASTAVMAGARLIGTNGDSTFPTPDGQLPGGGSLVAAVAAVAGVDPVIGGKPNRPMALLIIDIAGDPDRLVMVGDRLDTDGAFAATIGCPFALVRSGVTAPGQPLDLDRFGLSEPATDVTNLASFADEFADAASPAGQ